MWTKGETKALYKSKVLGFKKLKFGKRFTRLT